MRVHSSAAQRLSALLRVLLWTPQALVKDSGLTYTIGSLMRAHTLKLMLTSSGSTSQEEPKKVAQRKKVPPNLKRFQQLRGALLKQVLEKLEPPNFVSETWAREDMTEDRMQGFVYRALKVPPDRAIPYEEYPQMKYTDGFLDACLARYNHLSRPLRACGLHGGNISPLFYTFSSKDGVVVKCALFPDKQILPPFPKTLCTDGNLIIKNEWLISATLNTIAPKRSCELQEEFSMVYPEGLDWQQDTNKWALPNFQAVADTVDIAGPEPLGAGDSGISQGTSSFAQALAVRARRMSTKAPAAPSAAVPAGTGSDSSSSTSAS